MRRNSGSGAGLSGRDDVYSMSGRGVLYALGADGVTRAAAARHVNAAFRARDGDGAHDDDDEDDDDASAFLRESVREYAPDPPLDFEPRTIAVSPSGHFAAIGGLRHALRAAGDAQTDPIPPSSALSVVTLRAATTLERRDAAGLELKYDDLLETCSHLEQLLVARQALGVHMRVPTPAKLVV